MSNEYLVACVEVACALVESSTAALEDDDDPEAGSANRPVITAGSGDQCLKPNISTPKGEGCLEMLNGVHDRVFPDPTSALRAAGSLLEVVTAALKSEQREATYRFEARS